MTEKENRERQLAQCRRMAASLTDISTIERLSRLAKDLEASVLDINANRRFNRASGRSG